MLGTMRIFMVVVAIAACSARAPHPAPPPPPPPHAVDVPPPVAAAPDGKLVAYVLSTGGGEVGVLHVMDAATGVELPDRIERIWGEGAASWLPDGRAFFYAQLAVPQPGVDPMANQIARLHKLGD